MIHKHQINGLQEMSQINGVVAGFVFNFRNEKEKIETTQFQDVWDFFDMIESLDKKSFNEKDLLNQNPIQIYGKKKRVNYTWDMETFLKNYDYKEIDEK